MKRPSGFAATSPERRNAVARLGANHRKGFAALPPERRRELARRGAMASAEAQAADRRWRRHLLGPVAGRGETHR